jgi:hypothetical protein
MEKFYIKGFYMENWKKLNHSYDQAELIIKTLN